MEFLLNGLIFCIVLFLYLHIYFHYKTSNDLEVYELSEPSKDKLEEICDIKQPIIFDFPNEELLSKFKIENIINNYSNFDIKIRNLEKKNQDDEEMYIPMTLKDGLKGLEKTKSIIENNGEFLEETGMKKILRFNDSFLRPNLVSSSFYDILISTNKYQTPLKYEINNRNYLLVIEGKLKIKLAPPKSNKYLNKINDYENFEFRTDLDVWDTSKNTFKNEIDKVKFLEVEIKPSQIIFIPAYWWYSLEFDKNTILCKFNYRTFSSSIAILPDLFMRLLQNQNIKRKIANSLKLE